MIKCVMQGFTFNKNGNFILLSGFNNGLAVLTVENKKGFKTIHINVARAMLNKSVCPLNAPDSALNKLHKQHINKGIKQNG